MLKRKQAHSCLVCFLMVLMLLFGVGIGFNSHAEGEGDEGTTTTTTKLADKAKIDVTYIKNGSVNLLEESEPTVTYGDMLEFHLTWAFDDNTEITTSDKMVYDLPDVINYEEATGNLLDGEDVVGTYTIKGHQITIQYNDKDKKFTEQHNRKGGLKFSGEIKDNGNPDEPVVIKFDDTNINLSVKMVQPKPKSEINIQKYFSDYKPEDHIYRAYVHVISKGDNTNIHISDENWPGMTIVSEPVVYYDDDDHTPVDSSRYTYNPDDNGRQYTMDVTSMAPDEDFYIRYEVKLDPALFDESQINTFVENRHNNPHYDNAGDHLGVIAVGIVINYIIPHSARRAHHFCKSQQHDSGREGHFQASYHSCKGIGKENLQDHGGVAQIHCARTVHDSLVHAVNADDHSQESRPEDPQHQDHCRCAPKGRHQCDNIGGENGGRNRGKHARNRMKNVPQAPDPPADQAGRHSRCKPGDHAAQKQTQR